MALAALPSDCLLACLARVPYADLRNGIPSTCKSLRDAVTVTSTALHKTREAAGWTEWAVFAGDATDQTNNFMITSSIAYRTAHRPQFHDDDDDDDDDEDDAVDLFVMRASMSHQPTASGEEELIVMENHFGNLRVGAYDPRRNRWHESSSLQIYGCPGGTALERRFIILCGRDMHIYDSAQDTWLPQPQLPFVLLFPHCIEVAGRLWCYISIDHEQETFIYDPETRLWTAGPRLPFKIYDFAGIRWHTNAFEVHGKFCIMAYFNTHFNTVKYLAFVWNPITEMWDEAPFPTPPVVGFQCSQIDGYLIVYGNYPSKQAPGLHGPYAYRLFVLSPGSAEWIEWRLPGGARTPQVNPNAFRIAAVRIG